MLFAKHLDFGLPRLETITAGFCILLGSATTLFATPPQNDQKATEIRRIPAAEADQGVASDAKYVYAIADSEIGKYDKATGKEVEHWKGDSEVFIHMNSCSAVSGELICAMSNFPNLPMSSSVEWFSAKKIAPIRTHSFGPGRGSLTWIDWHNGSWWACFANYDAKGGDPNRDHNASVLVRFSKNFIEQESWLFPKNLLEKFGHMSASGGRWGHDGFLYITGHDLPELYVIRLPKSGSRLEYVRTISIPTGGQAFDWDSTHTDRIWTIARKRAEMVESHMPTANHSLK
ncbi:hypothetical protein BH10ACI4_BH10ACI4_28980 [soil metagenome]